MLSVTIGAARPIKFLDLLLTGKRIGNQVGSRGKKTGQTMISSVVNGLLNGVGRVELRSWIGEIGSFGDIQKTSLQELVLRVNARGKAIGASNRSEEKSANKRQTNSGTNHSTSFI